MASPDLMSKMEENRFEWKFKKLVGSLVLSSGGTIFGGYVRDSILHDHFSKKYYEQCKKDSIHMEEEQIRYMDPDFYPEFKDRTLNPDDIDCFFTSYALLKNFEETLHHSKLCFTKVFVHDDVSNYITRLNLPPNTVSHIRYKVTHFHTPKKNMLKMLLKNSFHTLIRHELNLEIENFITRLEHVTESYPHIIIDALIQKTNSSYPLSPPFGKLDFECNGLLLSSKGLTIASDLKDSTKEYVGFIADITKQTEIIQDILQKKARLIQSVGYNVDKYRIDKMKEKGWDIIYGDFLNIVSQKSTDPEDVCIICHETVKDTEHYKLKCCSAWYHKKCLIDASITGSAAMAQTNKCIMCKKLLCNIGYDICILQIKI